MMKARAIAAVLAVVLSVLITPAAITSGAATTERVSISSAGVEGNNQSSGASISGDGRFVAFHSTATNLDPADTDAQYDVFVRDRLTGSTRLVSRAAGAGGAKGNYDSVSPVITPDGRYVAFNSRAWNIHPEDTDPTYDVFIRDLQTEALVLVSRASGISGAKGNGDSQTDDISPDGRYVSYSSFATNLDPDDSTSTRDIYVRDTQANITVLASRATGEHGEVALYEGIWSSISADGRFIAFTSPATNLSADDLDNTFDVFLRDSVAHVTTLVSLASGPNGVAANSSSSDSELTDDGRFVIFRSAANNLHTDDGDFYEDIFVRDLQTSTNHLVSRASGVAGAKGYGDSYQPAISPDGRYAAFTSRATNLHPDDSDPYFDAFARDLQTGITLLVSRSSGCAKGNEDSWAYPTVTDSAAVAFESSATNLVPADTNGAVDVFLATGLQFVAPTGEDACPEADNDGDGICDAGQASASCVGSDAGKYEWLNEAPGQTDCRNIPEDFDSFHDGDGCPERDNDYDGIYDRSDSCPGTDFTAGPDGVADTGDEPPDSQGLPVQTREDQDYVLDGDGCYDAPGADYDGDGFTDDIEALSIGTDAARSCGFDAWPLDINSDTFSDTADIGFLTNDFGRAVPPAPSRHNIAPTPPDAYIDTADIARMTGSFGASCALSP